MEIKPKTHHNVDFLRVCSPSARKYDTYDMVVVEFSKSVEKFSSRMVKKIQLALMKYSINKVTLKVWKNNIEKKGHYWVKDIKPEMLNIVQKQPHQHCIKYFILLNLILIYNTRFEVIPRVMKSPSRPPKKYKQYHFFLVYSRSPKGMRRENM